jgi:large exoprotein involved in heme utilization and adhesion
LLDPKDILIQAGSPISGLAISQALFLNDVILQADNDITVDDNITGIGANNLTFLAGRSLTIAPNRSILLNGGSFTAKFNDENALIPTDRDPGVAQFLMSPASQILTNGGDVTIASGTFGQTSQINTANAGIITSNQAGNSGNITLFSLGDATTGLLDTRSETGNGGNISVSSAGGAVETTNTILSNSLFQAGDISIEAAGNLSVSGGDINAYGATPGRLTITSGGTLSARGVAINNATLGNGTPNDVTITARAIALENSTVGIAVLGAGQGGNVLVQTEDEVVLRNSQIGAATLSSGNVGNLTLNARRLTIIKEPGVTIPSNFLTPFIGIGTIGAEGSSGNGGDVTINASELVEVIGDKPGAFVIDPIQVTTTLLQSDTGIASSAFGSGNSGDLTINTGRLVVRDGAGITTLPAVGEGGDLTVNASEIFIQGEAGLGTSTRGFGDAGDLSVRANNVIVTDGGAIAASTFSSGNAGTFELVVGSSSIRNGAVIGSTTIAPGNGGSVIVKASDFIEVVGTSADGRIASGIITNAFTPQSGNAGTIDIETDRLIVRQGGEVSTTTASAGQGGDIQIDTRTLQLDDGRINASTFGAGDGGNIAVRASESVDITGTGFNILQEQIIAPALEGNLTPDRFDQGIVTITGGEGNAGNVSITTPNFVTRNGGLVATTTLAGGDGGNIAIGTSDTLTLDDSLIGSGTFTGADSGDVMLNARRLIARGGAQVLTTTFGAGQAGDLTANVSDSIELINITNSGALLATGLFASSAQTASGDGGDININIPEGDLSLRDGATVSVSAEGEGNAGDINIDARGIFLDRASISATSTSGEGGNINLRLGEALILRNNSQISTRAGTDAGGGGDGGNMNIEAQFIIGVPQENSDITANAFAGNGGNIEISTQSIFGLQVRDELTPLSDITASSQLGIDGTIRIDRLSVDPSRGLAELPTAFSDPSDQIVAGCPADRGNRFVVTGRGGLPTQPSQYRRGRAVWRDTRDLSVSTSQPQAMDTEPSSPPFVEAQGWIVAENGTVVLTAEPHRGAGVQGSRGATGAGGNRGRGEEVKGCNRGRGEEVKG